MSVLSTVEGELRRVVEQLKAEGAELQELRSILLHLAEEIFELTYDDPN